MFDTLKKDLSRLLNCEKVNVGTIFRTYFEHLGYKSVVLYRVQKYFYDRNNLFFATFFKNKNLKLTGAEFCFGCEIDEGLVVQHPNGIVVGCGVIIGRNCTILQQVTVGENYKGEDHSYPLIGQSVTLCAGAKILGNIKIGDNSIVAANSVVIKSFDSNSVIAGVPAQCKKNR